MRMARSRERGLQEKLSGSGPGLLILNYILAFKFKRLDLGRCLRVEMMDDSFESTGRIENSKWGKTFPFIAKQNPLGDRRDQFRKSCIKLYRLILRLGIR